MAKRRKAVRRAALLLRAAAELQRHIFIAMSIARIILYGYRLNSANCQSARLVGVDPQIDPKRGYIVQALRFRADEGVCPLGYIGPYGTSFTLQVLILPILLTKADTHIKICCIHDMISINLS